MLQRWGNQADTSNNEMEYRAMFEALQFTHPQAFIIMETDSQGCLDGLTKFRLRWEKNGWKRNDGQLVENADLIREVCCMLDDRHVGFWKIKGHSKDPWNSLADSLAVRGRNVQSKMVVVQILFRAIIDGKETFQALPRISVSSHANIYDFWPALLDKFSHGIGEPEDYEIWQGHAPLRGPLAQGHTYEIVSRITPGRARPQAAARRNSIDLTTPPPPKLTPKGPADPKPKKSSIEAPLPQTYIEPPPHGVPPQWTAVVTYQAKASRRKFGEVGSQQKTPNTHWNTVPAKNLTCLVAGVAQPIGEMPKESA
jgi:ribonuclease HI